MRSYEIPPFIQAGRKKFSIIPNDLINEAGSLGGDPIVVYAMLRYRECYVPGPHVIESVIHGRKVRTAIGKGQCVFGREELAKRCGISEERTRKALKWLSDKGYISISARRFVGSVVTIAPHE